MFGIGLPEMLFIVVLLLVFFGPEQLAELARSVGQATGRAWKMSQGVREEIDRELGGLDRWAAKDGRWEVRRASPAGPGSAAAPDAPGPRRDEEARP